MIFKDINNRYSKPDKAEIQRKGLVFDNNLNNLNLSFGFDFANTLQSDSALIKCFSELPEIYGVVTFMVNCMTKVGFKMYNSKNEEIIKHDIITLLKNPNYFQSKSEFLSQVFAFDYITGNSFINIFAPFGMKPSQLFILPSQRVQIMLKNPLENSDFRTNEIVKYKFLMSNANDLQIDVNNILHRKRINLNYDFGNYLLGISPLLSAKMPINSLISAYEAQLSIFQNRGAMGILTSKVAEMPILDKDALSQEYYNTYGMNRNKSKIMITRDAVDYIQMGLPISELQLNETNLANLESVCLALNVNPALFKNTGASTYDNIKLFINQLWTSNIVPKLDDFYRDLTNSLRYFWKEDFIIVPDYSNIDELKKDEKLIAEKNKIEIATGVKTPNQIIEEHGGVPSSNPAMNEFYLPSNLVKVGTVVPSKINTQTV